MRDRADAPGTRIHRPAEPRRRLTLYVTPPETTNSAEYADNTTPLLRSPFFFSAQEGIFVRFSGSAHRIGRFFGRGEGPLLVPKSGL